MKKLIFLLLVGGSGFVLCALMGYINVPGLTPASTPISKGEKLEPPKEKPAEKPTSSEPGKEAPPPGPSIESKKIEPSAPAKKRTSPPPSGAAIERAKTAYWNADWSGVARALPGCEDPDLEDGSATQAARALVRKARLLDLLTQKFKRNRIASARNLERVESSHGTHEGAVEDLGDRLRITRLGNVVIELNKDDVTEHHPITRADLEAKILDRLNDKESRIKSDDAFGAMRLGHFCWEYGLDKRAVPYLDKAVESDDFPVLAKVFGGSNATKLVEGWTVFSGKGPKAEPPAADTTASAPARPAEPAKPARPVSANTGNLAKAKQKYDEGVEKYKDSFGDSSSAQANLHAAHELFKQARDALGDAEDPDSDDLRTQISRLIYDCGKRSAIN